MLRAANRAVQNMEENARRIEVFLITRKRKPKAGANKIVGEAVARRDYHHSPDYGCL